MSDCQSADCLFLYFSCAEEASGRDEPDTALEGSGLPLNTKQLLRSLKRDVTRIITFSDDDLQVRAFFFLFKKDTFNFIGVQTCAMLTAGYQHFLGHHLLEFFRLLFTVLADFSGLCVLM